MGTVIPRVEHLASIDLNLRAARAATSELRELERGSDYDVQALNDLSSEIETLLKAAAREVAAYRTRIYEA